eukprot:TRINITY_DN56636_c0_g1_i1.p2 TRINITY_DN56636_c0_g1~~TRINITY_DN56636_c0_g1_i1.p2  ORF type:complete len:124 (-),score=4.83 TRINITY_DN56636_c0_g1_i1:460-831(-)
MYIAILLIAILGVASAVPSPSTPINVVNTALACRQTICSNHGQCRPDNSCDCDSGFDGSDCSTQYIDFPPQIIPILFGIIFGACVFACVWKVFFLRPGTTAAVAEPAQQPTTMMAMDRAAYAV